MTIADHELKSYRVAAVEAVRRAGMFVASARPQTVTTKTASEGAGDSEASSVVTEVDARAQTILLETLMDASLPFEPGVLSEELPDDDSRHRRSHFWCIDPLDGTLPFIEGVPGYAVSVALVRRDGVPLVGAVYDPCTGRLFDAVRGGGARIDGAAWSTPRAADDDDLHVFVDRSFAAHSGFADIIASLETLVPQLGGSGLRTHVGAGAVMNACGVFCSAPACYLKLPKATPGGGSVWDFAGTACIAAELGAQASDVRGEPLALNPTGSTFMNARGVLFATGPELSAAVQSVLAAVSVP